MTLLVVEDDAKVSAMLRQGLQEAGYTTILARTAPQAIELLDGNAFVLEFTTAQAGDGQPQLAFDTMPS